MQREFNLLAVCDDSAISCLVEGTTFSQQQVYVSGFDIETLKTTYKNTSEEALYFVMRKHRAASNRKMSTKKEELGSSESNGDRGEAATIQNASSPCPSFLLPPPKRFARTSKRASQTTKSD
jgi:hypothetical protein